MEGRPDPPHLRGIIPNSFQHIFEFVANAEKQQFLVRASYLEIYNEEIRDLLSKDPKNNLELKENIDTGVYVKDLTSFVVKNAVGTYVFFLTLTNHNHNYNSSYLLRHYNSYHITNIFLLLIYFTNRN